MASLTRWTWVWVNSGSWWGTGRPGVLRFMGLQRVGHDWVTDLIWFINELILYCIWSMTKVSFLFLFLKFMTKVLKWKLRSVVMSVYMSICVHYRYNIFFYLWMILPKLICKRPLFNWHKSKCKNFSKIPEDLHSLLVKYKILDVKYLISQNKKTGQEDDPAEWKRCTMWELWVKFYLGQNEDCSPGGLHPK